jgi:putative ABC transport system ATP-binding protein
MIKVKNLSKSFVIKNAAVKVLDNVSFEFNQGTIYAITGVSGSGKTTLLNILTLNDVNYSGVLEINGINVKLISKKVIHKLKSNITYLAQGQAVFETLLAYENIKIINSKLKLAFIELIFKKFNLNISSKIKTKNLSGGEQQRLGFIRSLNLNNPIIVLDEPTSNLDTFNRMLLIENIKNYKKNRIIIIATHDQELINQCDVELCLTQLNYKNEVIKKDKSSLKLSVKSFSIFPLILADLKTNFRFNMLFISTLITALSGGLLGFILTGGVDRFFVKVLDQEVSETISVVEPKSKVQELLNSDFIYYEPLSKTSITTSYFEVYNSKVDLLNTFRINDSFDDKTISLELEQANYDRLRTASTISFFGNNNQVIYRIDSVKRSNKNLIVANKDFNTNLVNSLSLKDSFITKKSFNFVGVEKEVSAPKIKEILKRYVIEVKEDLIVIIQGQNYLVIEDLNRFENFLICNQKYGIFCDVTLGIAYINLKINNKDMVIKLVNRNSIAISSALWQEFDPKLSIYFLGNNLIKDDRPDVIDNKDLILYFPYHLLSQLIINNYGIYTQAERLLVEQNIFKPYFYANYKINNPYQTFYEPFKELLDTINFGIIVYSLLALALALLTVFLISFLEVENRKRYFGTLLLLGWSKRHILSWIVILNGIKTLIAYSAVLLITKISLAHINNLFKELSNHDQIFVFPSFIWMLTLIISLLIIVGIITTLNTLKLLKNPPKKLLTNF